MFKSLQARLILSYVVIILVCLVLVGLAALVLLRGYQRNLTITRLADRSVLAARLAAEALRQGVPPQEAVDRLAQQMNRADRPPILVYLLDDSGRVLVGSDGRLAGRRLEQLAIRPARLGEWPLFGEYRPEGGERLLYAADIVRPPIENEPRPAAQVLVLAEPFRPVRFALGDLLPRLLWAGLIALAVSVVVAAVMAYSIARPLDRIARAAEEVAAGDFRQPLDISSPAEVARLATSFNSMARQIQLTLQSQQDLVANVSHELKTPLTSIQGFSQALLDGTAGDPAARERAASIIFQESGRMRRLVEDLLDLARLEAGQVTLAREAVDIGELLRASAARLGPQAEQEEIAVEVEIAPALALVTGDADRLGQVFGNLLDNALKHARHVPGGGRVVLRAEQQDHKVICSVTDNGSGIPAQDQRRIFERFYQVDKSRVRRGGGAGLGLAIAQEIVQSHGGRIGVESVEGLGTRFTVELPARNESRHD